MNPQYMNQQNPAGYNPGYGAPPSSQAPQNFGAQQAPPGQFGGAPHQNMFNGSSQRPIGPPGTFGPPQTKAGPPGPQIGASRMPMSNAGPPMPNAGPSMSNAGPPMPNAGPSMSNAGPPMSNAGPPMSNAGPPMSNAGPPMSNAGPPMSNAGPPISNGPYGGPTVGVRGPSPQGGFPGMTSRPPAAGDGQPSRPSGPPGSSGQPQPPFGQLGPTGPQPGPPGPQPGPPGPQSGPPGPQSGPPGPPSGPPGPQPGPSGANQMTNQMGAMHLGNQQFPIPGGPMGTAAPPQPGYGQFPPSSVQQPGMPPPISQAPPPIGGGPPSQPGYQIGMPPMTGAPGPPSGPMGYNQAPPPGMPPSSMAGPQSSIPGQYGAPPGGMPPPHGPDGFQGTYQGGQRAGLPNAGPMAAPTQPTQQPRRLDPDQMPSPIQVIEDDRHNRSGEFVATQRGAVPPLVTTEFTAEDRGNSNPRLIRSTMYNVPCTADMLKQSNLPFVIAISPFARLAANENPLPVVDLGQLGPVRCNRCKAYMNPYMQFVDGGRRFQCCFCGCHSDVPPEYFAHLDHTGRRVDSYERPELCLGAYEFVATSDYCKNNKLPKPPAFIFMIDVSYNAVKSGLVHLLCEHLKDEVLVNLPKENGMEESEIRVGFVTYAKELHFYNVKGNLAQPQMMVVSDVQDVFVPLLDGFLVKLSESEAVIDTLLSQIPLTFAESRETEIVLGPVIQAGLDALKAAECTGKLFIFHTSLPIAEAPGKLKNRDDRKLLGTEKEKTILTPANNFYTKLGQECVAAGCGVDLFLFPNSYIDIATIAEVPRLTGGNIYKYSYFQADLQGQRLMEDLKLNVMRPIAFDAIMRVRSSTGIRPVDFFGNFYMANTTDVELASMDCDKTVTVEIKHDDKLSEADGACIQAAVLYTSISGQRRLRVINMSYSCSSQMAELFRNCELDALINYMAKLAIRESLNSNPKMVRENLMNRCAQILACYRKNCASPSSAGQLILPECMKLLPLYSNCIVKSPALQASEAPTDDRSYLIHMVNGMSVEDSQVFFYPRLLPLHELDMDSDDLPSAIRCSYERLKDNGVYLIDNGLCMLIWIGMNVSTDWVVSLFGVQSVAQIDIDMTSLQNLDNPISRRVRGVIQKIREERFGCLKLLIVRQRDKLEPVFQQYLAEDRSASGGASYVDFLCHIHKEIRSLLS